MTAPHPTIPAIGKTSASLVGGKVARLPIRTVQRRRGGEWHEVLRIGQEIVTTRCGDDIPREWAKPLAQVEDESGIGCKVCLKVRRGR